MAYHWASQEKHYVPINTEQMDTTQNGISGCIIYVKYELFILFSIDFQKTSLQINPVIQVYEGNSCACISGSACILKVC